jgi:hypothetical protein
MGTKETYGGALIDAVGETFHEAYGTALAGPTASLATYYASIAVLDMLRSRGLLLTPAAPTADAPAPAPGGVMTDAELVTRGADAADLADTARKETP